MERNEVVPSFAVAFYSAVPALVAAGVVASVSPVHLLTSADCSRILSLTFLFLHPFSHSPFVSSCPRSSLRLHQPSSLRIPGKHKIENSVFNTKSKWLSRFLSAIPSESNIS